MILIISDKYDSTTCEIIDWLIFNKHAFIRINDDDKIEFQKLRVNNDDGFDCDLLIHGTFISLSQISGYWFRRGFLNIFPNTDLTCLPEPLQKKVKAHLVKENETLRDYLYSVLAAKNSIGSPLTDRVNKLICLQRAKEFGLNIPSTEILTNRFDMETLVMSGSVISKGIQDVTSFQFGSNYYANFTEEVNDFVVESVSSKSFPSLFQEKLDKEYEIRTFFLKGHFYSMCIFSQLDQQTSLDFRKYNKKRPNRFVPYKLPNDIETKLCNLMNSLNLKTGSIDLVFTKSQRYYFLEVNPVGQFGMVSYPCNYNLEEKMAFALTNN